MTTYNWQITSMPAYSQVDGESDVVFQVNWICQASENRLSASSAGSVSLTYTAGEAFTPYDELTEQQVWDWINPNIDRQEIETNLQAMLDEQKSPPVVTHPLPWSQI